MDQDHKSNNSAPGNDKLDVDVIDSHIHLYTRGDLARLNWTSGLAATHILNRQHSVREYRNTVSVSGERALLSLRGSGSSERRPENRDGDDVITMGYRVRGFVFVETDRVSGLGEGDWADVLEEVGYLLRIANDEDDWSGGQVALQTKKEDASLVLGIVPWAPVLGGAAVLRRYLMRVREVCSSHDSKAVALAGARSGDVGNSYNLIKGFRYLVQDKPSGTMLDPPFVEGVNLLGQEGFTFDLGIDFHSVGGWQLDEAVEMMRMLDADHSEDTKQHEPNQERTTTGQQRERREQRRKQKTKIVINHLCKPPLDISHINVEATADFQNWNRRIRTFATYPTTYMKLSGLFSELPLLPASAVTLTSDNPSQQLHIHNKSAEQQSDTSNWSTESIYDRVKPWVDVIFDAFGPERIMFGSDWPVCTNNEIEGGAWRRWVDVVALLMEKRGLDDAQRKMVWSGTASFVYDISRDDS